MEAMKVEVFEATFENMDADIAFQLLDQLGAAKDDEDTYLVPVYHKEDPEYIFNAYVFKLFEDSEKIYYEI